MAEGSDPPPWPTPLNSPWPAREAGDPGHRTEYRASTPRPLPLGARLVFRKPRRLWPGGGLATAASWIRSASSAPQKPLHRAFRATRLAAGVSSSTYQGGGLPAARADRDVLHHQIPCRPGSSARKLPARRRIRPGPQPAARPRRPARADPRSPPPARSAAAQLQAGGVTSPACLAPISSCFSHSRVVLAQPFQPFQISRWAARLHAQHLFATCFRNAHLVPRHWWESAADGWPTSKATLSGNIREQCCWSGAPNGEIWNA